MIKHLKALFKPEPTIKFKPYQGAPNLSPLTRIHLASEIVPTWLAEQRNYEDSRNKFHNCPGMSDLMRAGYIITAWDDIRIKANRAGVVSKMEINYTRPVERMNTEVVAGIVEVEDIPLHACKLSTPWCVTTRKGYSAMVVAATYHSPFLKDLHVYGGIVDYDNFHTINFIFTPLRECEVFIPAGTPLLQVIPYRRETSTGVTGSRTQHDVDKQGFTFPTRVRGAYRKFFHARKKYLLEHQE